jgi:hypothetical protein
MQQRVNILGRRPNGCVSSLLSSTRTRPFSSVIRPDQQLTKLIAEVSREVRCFGDSSYRACSPGCSSKTSECVCVFAVLVSSVAMARETFGGSACPGGVPVWRAFVARYLLYALVGLHLLGVWLLRGRQTLMKRVGLLVFKKQKIAKSNPFYYIHRFFCCEWCGSG